MHIPCSPACGHRGYMKAIPRSSVAAFRYLQHSSVKPAQRWCLQKVSAVAGTEGATLATEASDSTERVSQAYPFTEIESKWQAYWEEQQTFRTPEKVDTSKPKYYVLDMFPYPRCECLSISKVVCRAEFASFTGVCKSVVRLLARIVVMGKLL